jgi:CRP-like cAMP-binding protein
MSLDAGRFDSAERKLSALLRAPLFRGASPAEAREIAGRSRTLEFRRKQRLLEDDAWQRTVALVSAGRLKTTAVAAGGREVLLELAGPGEVVGALVAPPGPCSPMVAEALEAGHALLWDSGLLARILERVPLLHRNALELVSERLRRIEERYLEQCTEPVPVRLARTLMRLLAQMGRPVAYGVIIALSQEDLALIAGTTLFTVSRLLSKWQAAGMLRTGREAIVVRDVERLATVSGGDSQRAPGSS